MINIKTKRNTGSALLISIFLFLVISSTIVFGIIQPVTKSVQNSTSTRLSRESFFVSQSGLEDVLYRIASGKKFNNSSVLNIDGHLATTTVTNVSGELEIVAEGMVYDNNRKIKARMLAGSGASFPHGSQTGEGGLVLENSSSVLGNVFSNGPVVGGGSNLIQGVVISAGDNGYISGLNISESAYANEIENSDIAKDAFYNVISGTTVSGSLNPNSANQGLAPLPIVDLEIEEMKVDALSGGVISSPCKYKITSDVTIGPKKIDCDLEISGSAVVTLTGNIWVSGNVEIKNTATVKVDQSLGAKSLAIIAANEEDPLNSGKIILSNSVSFMGSGVDGSNITLISQNTSAENGGSVVAIDIGNTASGDLVVFSGHGEILLQNNIHLKGVSGYRVRLRNSAQVEYDTGIASLLFNTGSGGGYVFAGWREVE